MTQISARLDYVENLTRQRHDRDQTENQQNAATVDTVAAIKSQTFPTPLPIVIQRGVTLTYTLN